MEIAGSNEYPSVVDHIYEEVLETYPFLTSEERLAYVEKAEEVLNDAGCANQLKGVIQLLGLLHNPHADYWLVEKAEKDKKAPPKPELKIEDGILYIKVPAWTKRLPNLAEDLTSFCKENEDKYKAVIIDVRENTGGNSRIAHKFAGIFFDGDVAFGKLIKKNKSGDLRKRDFVIPASGEVFIDKPLVILISNQCFSSNELFLAPFKVTGRATLIGEKTRGGSGNPVEVEINVDGKRYIVRIPTWRFVLRGENKPIEETSIVPDISYTKADIVDYAKEYLKDKLTS